MRLTMKKWSCAARGFVLATAAMAGLSLAGHAKADELLLSSMNLVKGASVATYSFTTTQAGTITATLTNLPWPQNLSLSELDFSATSATSTLSSWSTTSPKATNASIAAFSAADDAVSATRTESFTVGAGTYFAHIMATAGNNELNLGLYSLNLMFTPSAIPLPGSEWMLLGGVLMLFGLTRWNGILGRLMASKQGFTLAH